MPVGRQQIPGLRPLCERLVVGGHQDWKPQIELEDELRGFERPNTVAIQTGFTEIRPDGCSEEPARPLTAHSVARIVGPRGEGE